MEITYITSAQVQYSTKKLKVLFEQYIQALDIKPNSDFSVVVLFKNEVIGIVQISHNPFHPYNDYFQIHISHQYRQNGIGTEILKILEKSSKKINLQCLLHSQNLSLIKWLERRQFQKVRETHEICINTLENKVEEFPKLYIQNYSQLDTHTISLLAEMVHFNYSNYHSNVNPLNLELNPQSFFTHIQNMLIPEYSYVLFPKDINKFYFKNINPNAYILVEKLNDESAMIIYLGGKNESHKETYLAFFQFCITNLLMHFKTLHFELDNTDFYANLLLQNMKLNNNEKYLTFVKSIKTQ